MRLSSVIFGLAVAIAAPCGFALVVLSLNWDVSPWWYPSLFGTGLGGGMMLMAVLDLVDYFLGRTVSLDQTQAQTDATRVATDERRARLETVNVPRETSVPDDDRGWYLAIEIVLLAGQVTGFTDEGLSGVLGSDGRPLMQRFLTERGILTIRPGSAGYGWAEGVTLADALRKLKVGSLAPYPAGPAPEVRPPVQVATRRDTPRRRATAPAVIDREFQKS